MQHIESMGDKWFALGIGAETIPGVVATTLELGGSRPVWSHKNEHIERILMAWPSDSLLRSSVLMAGKPEGKLSAAAVAPLMEGFANTLTIKDCYRWKDNHAGEILAAPEEFPPLWFYDPLFYRDAEGDVKEKTCEFLLSGLCFGLRRALLDELTVTQGPAYEKHAIEWMKQHSDKTRLDVPALKIPLKGKTIIDITDHCCEYQCRASIFDVDSFMFGPENTKIKIYRFGIAFGNPEKPVYAIIYAPERICAKGYVPQEGDDVDMIFWMQGRISDTEGKIVQEGELADTNESSDSK
ncbi:MAG: hypothetical protein ACI4P0_03645 [Mailhella sp.]